MALNKINIQVQILDGESKSRSTSAGRNRDTQSDKDFLDYMRTEFNQNDAHKISKNGFQFSQKEKEEALAFKQRLKKSGQLEHKNLLSEDKIFHGSI